MTAVCAAGDHLTAMAAGKETVVRMEAGAEAESPDNGVSHRVVIDTHKHMYTLLDARGALKALR